MLLNCVIVGSAIHSVENSIYSHKERLDQLIQYTIPSIKKYILNPYIIIIEDSNICKEYEDEIRNNCNQYINVSNETKNMLPLKGYRETYAINKGLNFIKDNISLDNIEWIFKLGGRYSWNEIFETNLNNGSFVQGKMNFLCHMPQCEYETASFAIHRDCFDKFMMIYQNVFNNMDSCKSDQRFNEFVRTELHNYPELINVVSKWGLLVRNTFGWYGGVTML